LGNNRTTADCLESRQNWVKSSGLLTPLPSIIDQASFTIVHSSLSPNPSKMSRAHAGEYAGLFFITRPAGFELAKCSFLLNLSHLAGAVDRDKFLRQVESMETITWELDYLCKVERPFFIFRSLTDIGLVPQFYCQIGEAFYNPH
jgi:hypothetical protein